MVAAVCPQLKGKYQCCSDEYFYNAKLKLKTQDLRNGFSMQAQPRVTGFRSLANSITYCKLVTSLTVIINVHPPPRVM